MTSYHAEAFRVLSLVVFLQQLFLDTDSSCHSSLTIHCDNLGVVNKAGSPDLADADADVFLKMKSELGAISKFLKINFAHVKGHQELDFDSTREEVLNHWCDEKSKGYCGTADPFSVLAASLVSCSQGIIL